MDRFGPRLHDKQLATVPILRPLAIHWPAVVPLDGTGPTGQLQNLLILEHEGLTFISRRLDVLSGPPPASAIHELFRFVPQGLFDDWAQLLVAKEGLKNQILIGGYRPLHHVFAQPPCRV